MAGLGRMKYMVLCNLPYRLREIAGRIAKKCRRRKDRSLEAKLEDIRNLLIYNHPISSVPPATGKLRLLQDGNTVLLALLRANVGKTDCGTGWITALCWGR